MVRKKPENVKLYPTEYQECCAFWDWICLYHHYKAGTAKICNERIGGAGYTMALKRIGMRKGFVDYMYLRPNKKYYALFIEMKRMDEKRTKKEQNDWIDYLNNNGYYATYAFGAMNAIEIFLDYVNDRI